MLSRLVWSLRTFFLLPILCPSNACHGLTLFPPPPPVFLGTTQRISWNSIPGDPPFFGLSAKCFGTPNFPPENCTTSDGEVSIALPGGFYIGITAPCSLLGLSYETGQEIAPEASFEIILNDPTIGSVPGTTTVNPQTHSSVHATPTPSSLTTEQGGNTFFGTMGSTASQNISPGPPSVTSATGTAFPQSHNSITNGLSTGTTDSLAPQAGLTSSPTSTAQTSLFPPKTPRKVLPLGAIIGGSIAGFLVLGVASVTTWVLCIQRQRRRFASRVPVPLAYDSTYAQPMSSRRDRSVQETLLEKAEKQRQNLLTPDTRFSGSGGSSMSGASQEAQLRLIVQDMSERIQALEQRRAPEIQQVWLHPSDVLDRQPPPGYSDGGHGRSSNSLRRLPLIPEPPIEPTPLPVHSRTSLVATLTDAVGTGHYPPVKHTYNDNLA